jgi:hypothetical protein
MLTFDLSTDAITNSGDCLVLLNSSDVGIHSISFGSGSCGAGNHLVGIPTSSETAGLTNGTTWSVITSPSKGWCNDSYGGCPTISSIVSSINASGVTTNLGTQADYSRVSGLYFEKTNLGRIEFQNEMNFTDSDSLTWLSELDAKIDLGTLGKISLDADLIKNLVSTQAILTMKSLTFNDPEVLVDGAVDNSNVVSNLSYDKSSGTLTFDVAHFTVFTTREKSNSNNSTSSSGIGAPVCGNQNPIGTPDLFQINRKSNSATLYFTPVNNNTNNYYIAYSTDKNAEMHGVQFEQGFFPGVLNFTINQLKPGVNYYFKVRAGNGCATGNWSNILSSKSKINYRY